MFKSQVHAEPHTLTDETLDSYGRDGVALSRDAASVVTAALNRDAYEMETRGGYANREAALVNRELATRISLSLMENADDH